VPDDLTYAAFTGLSSTAQEWWQLLIFRFLSALGIGGEWAGRLAAFRDMAEEMGPWVAATLQSGVNLGVLLACLAGYLSKTPTRAGFFSSASCRRY